MPDLISPPPGQFQYYDDDMKLRDDDRDWLKEEISTQITEAISDLTDLLHPHGARRIALWLREWGLVATAVATPLTLLGILIAVSIFAASGLTKNAEFRAHTEDRLNAIEKDILLIRDELAPLVRETTIKGINDVEKLSSKELVARLPELRHLATVAKAEGVVVKPEVVEQVGKKLVEDGSTDSWNTAMDLLSYKSFLNVSLSLEVRNVIGNGVIVTSYRTSSPPGSPLPHFGVAGAVSKENAAQFQVIGGPDPNESSPLGNDWIVVEGGGLIIDNMRMKKVILRNVFIVYNGGPLQMVDVYFMNCTFSVKQQSNGQRLALALLEPSPATTLENPPREVATLFQPLTHFGTLPTSQALHRKASLKESLANPMIPMDRGWGGI